MWDLFFTCSQCCIKTAQSVPQPPHAIYNMIKANIRNFEPLSIIEKEFIISCTTSEQKIELIELYDMCMKVLLRDLLFILNLDNENISEKYRPEFDQENIRSFLEVRSRLGASPCGS